MGVAYTGSRDQPVVASSGNTPTFAADLTDISAFFAARSLRRFSTVASLLASSGSTVGDAAVADNAPGGIFVHTGSGWFMHGVARFADAAARNAALTAPQAGWKASLVSPALEYEYRDGAWKVSTPGIVPFASAAVSAQSVISIEGLTGFDEYEIVLDLPTASAANSFTAQLLSGSTPDATASSYDRQDGVASSTTAAAANQLGQTSWTIDQPGVRTDKHFTIVLYGLNAARRTIAEVRRRTFDASANPGLVISALRHRPSTVLNGIRLTTSTGTVTGTYTVKGIRYA